MLMDVITSPTSEQKVWFVRLCRRLTRRSEALEDPRAYLLVSIFQFVSRHTNKKFLHSALFHLIAGEHVMDHLALACQVSGDELRESNLYEAKQATHFGMILDDEYGGKWNVPVMWDRLVKELDVPKYRAAAAEFNSKNKWMKRGVSLVSKAVLL